MTGIQHGEENAMVPDLLQRKQTQFVLWRPATSNPVPRLIIGRYQADGTPVPGSEQAFDLQPAPGHSDLWQREARDCNLVAGQVYYYFFEVTNSHPDQPGALRLRCTDPAAETVDWRLQSPSLEHPEDARGQDPAGVVLYDGGRFRPCDPAGPALDFAEAALLDTLPPNNRLVIYELATRWGKLGQNGQELEGIGTFRDILALVDASAAPTSTFASVAALARGNAHLRNLGVNALELLPPADSHDDLGWGYATSNYFAADFDLGRPAGQDAPTASADLFQLIQACHRAGVRFFLDTVMGFSQRDAYSNINFLDFHVQLDHGDPEQDDRIRFGDLVKYNFATDSYDPMDGQRRMLVPARQLMKAHLARWMLDFHIDGLRLDSVNTIMNYDFVQEFKELGRSLWQARWQEQGHAPGGADERFLVVGEELSEPLSLLQQNRLDGLWHENFKRGLRRVILGTNADFDPSFEWSVRRLIDCRLMGFADGSQAVNYVTSHDVEGFRNERLFNYLNNNGIWETEKRIKLAFACLLTAVGIPMILAGEEFADPQNHRPVFPDKETDPVNFELVDEPWRRRVFDYVARLTRLRTTADALAVNDTRFLHVDFNDGKRVLVWQRGRPGIDRLVVVVANFSDWGTADPANPTAEYRVPNWPATPAGMRWREVPQDRIIAPERVGREPLYAWEAKVYALENVGHGPTR
jgi:1,4-alpha-glucan branching enzyme